MPDSPTRSFTRIIGIDCATDARKVGLALCTVSDGSARIEEVGTGRTLSLIHI